MDLIVLKEYWLDKLKAEIVAENISEIIASLRILRDELKPNDSIKLVLRGIERLTILSKLPSELRKLEFSLVWADEMGEEIITYIIYKPTSAAKVRLREHLRKHSIDTAKNRED